MKIVTELIPMLGNTTDATCRAVVLTLLESLKSIVGFHVIEFLVLCCIIPVIWTAVCLVVDFHHSCISLFNFRPLNLNVSLVSLVSLSPVY